MKQCIAIAALCGSCGGSNQTVTVDAGGAVDTRVVDADPGHFVVANGYSIGGGCPCGIALRDLDGDQLPELAVVSYGFSDGAGGSGVIVFPNRGHAVFGQGVLYPTGQAPVAVVAGDLSGDGKADLVVGNEQTAAISELVNRGDGTFVAAVGVGGGFGGSLASADLDGDGTLDVVAAGSFSVSVFRNGAAGLQGSSNPSIAAPSTGIAIGDLDGDGRPDLAVATWDGGHAVLSVLLNHGDGTFAAQVPYPSGPLPDGVVIADLDGDGKQDVVVATRQSQANVFLNRGDGTLAAYVTYATGVGNTMQSSIAVADLTGDGAPDLAIANDRVGGGGAASVLVNNGDGTFAPRIQYDLPSAAAVAIGDLDADGHPDLAVVGSGTLAVLLWMP